jgi:hypothetical protein
MPNPVVGIIGATVASGVGGAAIQSSAARRAGNVQAQAADQATAEQRRQFDAMQQLLRPYVNAGGPALQGIMDLAGLGQPTTNWNAFAQSNPELMAAFEAQQSAPNVSAQNFWGLGDNFYGLNNGVTSAPNMFGAAASGMGGLWSGRLPSDLSSGVGGMSTGGPLSLEQFAQQWAQQNNADVSQFTTDPQAAAVARIENQPMFQALARQGEDAILQNASATGGLRGGNTQGALARFRPSLLNQFIEQQYGRLAGITTLGQNAAAGVGSAGMQTGANIGNLLMAGGQAQAGAIGAQGQIFGNALGQIGGTIAGALMPRGPSAALLPSVQQTINANPRIF